MAEHLATWLLRFFQRTREIDDISDLAVKTHVSQRHMESKTDLLISAEQLGPSFLQIDN